MRKFVVIAVVMLSGMLCFTGCFKKKEKSGLDYMPKNASVIGSVNVVKLLSIQKVKDAVVEKETNPKSVEFKKAGLSSEKVKNISFGLDLSPVGEGKNPEWVSLIQLNAPVTDEEQVIDLLKKNMSDEVHAQFLSDDFLAVGTTGMVGEAVKLKRGTGEAVTANADFMGVSDKGSKTGLLWAAALVPKEQLKKLGEKAGASNVSAESIKNLYLGGDYSDATGFSLNVIITFNSKEEAEKIMPLIEMGKGYIMGKSQGKITGEMIKSEQKETQVSVSVKVPKAVLDELVEQATEAAEKTGVPPALESKIPME